MQTTHINSEEISSPNNENDCEGAFPKKKQSELYERPDATYNANIEHNAKHDPFNYLPTEIVARIFHSAIVGQAGQAMTGEAMQDGRTDYSTLPFQLAGVRQRWRHITMSAPELWTLLVIDRRGEKWTLPLDLVRQWFERAGVLPLRIILWWQPSGSPLDEDLISLVRFLCQHANRWGSVMFHIPGEVIPYFQSDADTTVDLDLFCLDSPSNTSHGWNMGQTIVRPRVATFIGLPVPPQSLQWTQTESLKMSLVFVSDCLQLLENCNDVKHCRVLLCRSIMDDLLPLNRPIPPHPTVMQSLRRLEVSFFENIDMFVLLHRICTPSLRSLTLFNVVGEGSYTPLTLLQDFFVTVRAHLTSLSLNGISFIVAQLEVVLGVLDSLKELRITCDESSGPFTSLNTLFNLLTSTLSVDSPASFLPKLRHFRYSGFKAFTWGAVATFVESHVNQQYNPSIDTPCKRPLTVLSISLSPPGAAENYIDKEVLLQFLDLSPSWMEISVGHELLQTSLQHHGIARPPHPIFRRHDS